MLALAAGTSAQANSLDISGIALQAYFNVLHVEQLWQKGYRTDWESGEQIGKAKNKNSTHCSTFVASVLKKKNIYILRPPEHRAKNLANAQWDYLKSDISKRDGWIETKESYAAIQDLANKGYFIIAVLKNSDPRKSGHIALIYPHHYKEDKVQKYGPYVIQAGHINAKGITLLKGFEKHKDDLSNLSFYYNKNKYTP